MANDILKQDFKNVPFGTDYGTGDDEKLNKEVEARRIQYLEDEIPHVKMIRYGKDML